MTNHQKDFFDSKKKECYMSTNNDLQPSGKNLQISTLPNQHNLTRRHGNFRAATLNTKTIMADQLFGAQKLVSDSTERLFSKTSFHLQLEADRNAYQFKILH